MKIMHLADLHLGSQMKKFPKDKAEERRREIRSTFERAVAFARSEGIKNILLSGDVFDSDRPFKKDKEYFYSVVRHNADMDFYYLRGNHDGQECYREEIGNLKTFGESWKTYPLGAGVAVSGLEINAGNCVSMYSSLALDPSAVNIVMLHGDIGEASGENKINKLRLRDRNIDYLALGHIHSFRCDRIDERGIFAYSGCLEGRGFDETGEKGFVIYDTETKEAQFKPFAYRTVEECDADITGAQDSYDAVRKIKSFIDVNEKNLLRINLTGTLAHIDEMLASDVEADLRNLCYCVSVKNKTKLRIDYSALYDSKSLKGEFVRCVTAEETDEETRQKILDLGLKALSGQADI